MLIPTMIADPQVTDQPGRRLQGMGGGLVANPPVDVLLLLPASGAENPLPSLYGSNLVYAITPSASEPPPNTMHIQVWARIGLFA